MTREKRGTAHTTLGIDPGTATMGWGVVRWGSPGNKLAYVEHGAITTPSDWDMPRRLGTLFNGVTDLVREHRPQVVSIEQLFFNTNVTTAMTVGQARGVAILAAYREGVEVAEYTPLQIKQAITSYGRADKRQMQEMVKALLNLRETPKPDDAADGLAVAICHAFSARMGGVKISGLGNGKSGGGLSRIGVGK
jgi:crossover junction endodeoxyribonuclease RuvC